MPTGIYSEISMLKNPGKQQSGSGMDGVRASIEGIYRIASNPEIDKEEIISRIKKEADSI
ncbi:hypothetical protein [[Clostridium] scindens]|uniref:hypothetical protein n=1 Tax=Clostridium scindens (strain JCM 10418 / VPI 12708) TaxID=29347 RepID=UPI00102E73F8|nr:hypothetical protein [[Clostridium] scindens]BDF14875.1 hypothetical protein CE91St59_01380 [[Clostridium] scindens]BDF18559.1 hypothetical protein CE91St60_01420 [[Clostridium] scindens]